MRHHYIQAPGGPCGCKAACIQVSQSLCFLSIHRFPMRAGFGGLSTWWQQEIGSGHSTWALTVHVRHPMCVRCKELVCPCTPVLGISVKANDHPPPITSHIMPPRTFVGPACCMLVLPAVSQLGHSSQSAAKSQPSNWHATACHRQQVLQNGFFEVPARPQLVV